MRLMIVDDDYQIREGMRLGVEWEKFGINDVCTCANGIEAMEVFQEKEPDIILADVQMPGMTGLELITRIREKTSETRVIFISAYSEFEYCRQALQLGADDYILKPIQFLKLEEVILKNVEIIRKRRSETARYTNALVEQEVRAICEEGQERGKKLCEILKGEYPFIEEGHFFTIVLTLDNKKESNKEIIQTLEEVLFEKGNGLYLAKKKGEMLFLALGNASALLAVYQQTELRNRIQYWNQLHGERVGIITAGISQNHDSNHFLRGFLQAKEAYEYQFYQGEGSANAYPVTMKKEFSKEEEKIWISRFQKALQANTFGKVEEVLKQWEEYLRKECFAPKVLKYAGWNIYRELCKKEKILDFPLSIEGDIGLVKSLDIFIKTFCSHIYHYIWEPKHRREKEKTYSKSVKMAISYVSEHYGEPLTMGWVAEEVGKSTNYFSATFKKEVGVSFTEYLTTYRMERAKYLLLNTNKKIKEVCEEVGYTDYTYFSQIFKQVHGCSASQIRQNQGE